MSLRVMQPISPARKIQIQFHWKGFSLKDSVIESAINVKSKVVQFA